MKFTCVSPLTWGGQEYQRGDVIDIPDGHPRLSALVRARFVVAYVVDPNINALRAEDEKFLSRAEVV